MEKARPLLSRVGREAVFYGSFFAVAYNFTHFFYRPTLTAGPSMYPTLNAASDSVVVSHRIDPEKDLKVGDIVQAECNLEVKQSKVLKRVKGLPGDTIKVTFYSPAAVGWTEEEEQAHEVTIQVPPAHVWLEGDNPRQSTDSRTWGPVPLALIEGMVVARLNPLNRKSLETPEHIKRKWERQARELAEVRAAAAKKASEEALRVVDRLLKEPYTEEADVAVPPFSPSEHSLKGGELPQGPNERQQAP